jgi:hypothetical protein
MKVLAVANQVFSLAASAHRTLANATLAMAHCPRRLGVAGKVERSQDAGLSPRDGRYCQ